MYKKDLNVYGVVSVVFQCVTGKTDRHGKWRRHPSPFNLFNKITVNRRKDHKRVMEILLKIIIVAV